MRTKTKAIASIDHFELRQKTFLSDHVPTTHEIEIVEWAEDFTHCYTIADFGADGEIISCGDRLFNAIHSMRDVENIKVLAKIAALIICETEEI